MDIKAYISSGIIESYVMGICSREEESELELLRGQYPELDAAILNFEDAFEKEITSHAVSPGQAVDGRILNKLEALNNGFHNRVSETPNLTPVIPIERKPKTGSSWLKPFAIAASFLLLLSAGFNYYLYKKNQNPPPVAVIPSLPLKDYEVMKNPEITPVALYGVGYHSICRCTLFWDNNTGKAYLMIHHLPPSSDTQDYQLWANVGGKQVSVGIVQDDIRGRFIEMKNVPSTATEFLVTLENAGGGSAPNMSEVYLKGKI